MSKLELVSFEPATGAELWRGEHGDVDVIVGRARQAWPAWASISVSARIERVRAFANEVRRSHEEFAELIARETGWSCAEISEMSDSRMTWWLEGLREFNGKKSAP